MEDFRCILKLWLHFLTVSTPCGGKKKKIKRNHPHGTEAPVRSPASGRQLGPVPRHQGYLREKKHQLRGKEIFSLIHSVGEGERAQEAKMK